MTYSTSNTVPANISNISKCYCIDETVIMDYRRILSLYTDNSLESDSWTLKVKNTGETASIQLDDYANDIDFYIVRFTLIDALVSECRLNTVKILQHNIDIIIDYLYGKNLSIKNIRPIVVDSIIEFLKGEKTLSNVQRNNCMRALGKLTKTAAENNMLSCGIVDCTFRWKEKKTPKRAPDSMVIRALDRVLFNIGVEVPLAFRTAYFLMRTRANRISEILSMPIDCIKYPEEGVFCVSIPTAKETPNHNLVYNDYSYLLDGLIETTILECLIAQRKFAIAHQNSLSNYNKGYLFVSASGKGLVTIDSFNRFLSEFIKKENIRDTNGNLAEVTSHDFRHIAVCERLQGNIISPIQTMVECNHHNLAQTMEYGYPSLHDETKHLADISQEVFNFEKNKKILPRALDENKYDRLLNLPSTRLLPGYGICINESCTPRFEKCFQCDSFCPNPVFRDYMLATIDLLEKRNEKLSKKKGTDLAIKKNQHQIELFQKFLSMCQPQSTEETIIA